MLTFRELLTTYNGTGLYMGLYAAALLYVVAKGSRREKIIFLSTPVMMVFAFNPFSLLLAYTAFGEAETMYRLFWMLPTCVLLAYFAAKWVGVQTEKKQSFIAAATCLVIVALCGQFVLQTASYTVAQNPMKIPEELVEIVDIIHEDQAHDETLENKDVSVVVSPHFIFDIRLYDPSLILAYSQDERVGRFSGTNKENMQILVDSFANNTPHEAYIVEAVLYEEEANYIICPQNYGVVPFLQEMDTELLATVGEFVIYKYNGGITE